MVFLLFVFALNDERAGANTATYTYRTCTIGSRGRNSNFNTWLLMLLLLLSLAFNFRLAIPVTDNRTFWGGQQEQWMTPRGGETWGWGERNASMHVFANKRRDGIYMYVCVRGQKLKLLAPFPT